MSFPWLGPCSVNTAKNEHDVKTPGRRSLHRPLDGAAPLACVLKSRTSTLSNVIFNHQNPGRRHALQSAPIPQFQRGPWKPTAAADVISASQSITSWGRSMRSSGYETTMRSIGSIVSSYQRLFKVRPVSPFRCAALTIKYVTFAEDRLSGLEEKYFKIYLVVIWCYAAMQGLFGLVLFNQ